MQQSRCLSSAPKISKRRKPRLQVSVLRVAEDSEDGYRVKRRTPFARPRILVLEEHHGSLYQALHLLKSSGYAASIIPEKDDAIKAVITGRDTHFVLLTAYPDARSSNVPQLIAGLQTLLYDQSITCCVRGKVSAALRTAYKNLSVDRVLALPAMMCDDILDALTWIDGQVVLGEGGLTILEV